jgi:hypothetical protein
MAKSNWSTPLPRPIAILDEDEDEDGVVPRKKGAS